MRKSIPYHILFLGTGLLALFLLSNMRRSGADCRQSDRLLVQESLPTSEEPLEEIEIESGTGNAKHSFPLPEIRNDDLAPIDQLRREFSFAVKQGRGEDALAIFLELANLGKEGFPFAVEAGNILLSLACDEVPLKI